MTIDEAIEHCLEKGNECTECGKEHLQLAEWLKENKELKEKQTPKKVMVSDSHTICPECFQDVLSYYSYCPDCGQKLSR